MERKLVTFRTIKAITPIEGADQIEAIQIDGWQVVSQKGIHQVGHTVLYFEVDSFLPIEPRYEFLRKGCLRKQDGVEGFRLKTIKLRGAISQGLIMPLSDFPKLSAPENEFKESLDEILGVVKWEPPIPAHLAGMVKGNFPGCIKKTDQERIQNLPEYFDGRFKGKLFEVSVKMDGSSCTIYYNNGDFGVCSRNLDLKEDETNTFWKVAKRLGLRAAMESKGKNVAIQGELAGEGVQDNRDKLKGQDLFVFDVWDIDEQRHMTSMERADYLTGFNIKHVPVVGIYPVFDICPTMEIMISYSGAEKTPNGNIREGLVFKSVEPDRNGSIISFKVINPLYLLKERD